MEAVNARVRQVFIGLFLIIVPPTLMLVSAKFAVDQERWVRQGLEGPSPVWNAVFPIALLASIIGIPFGGYLIFRALKNQV